MQSRFARWSLSGLLAAAAAFSGVPVLAAAPALPGGPEAASSFWTPSPADTLAREEALYRQHIFTLANPFFEGRVPGTRGNDDAADYLQFWFERHGLAPAFTAKDGKPSYFQPFSPQRLRRAGVDEQRVVLPGGRELEPTEDYSVLAYSDSGNLTAPVVFAGYAIEQGAGGYRGFVRGPAGSNGLGGKIALILRFEPMTSEGRSRWADEGWSEHAGLLPKIRAAVERGAKGVIIVNPPGAQDPRASRLMRFIEGRAEGTVEGVPVVMLSQPAADAMLAAVDPQKRTLDQLRAHADESGEMLPLGEQGVTISVKINPPGTTHNVGAVLRGKGALADEYVVIGAHFDHVGYGDFGSLGGREARGKIHPGADDNASGTSGMLTLAARFAEHYKSLPDDANARSIAFFGWSAEESGLEGSAFYCNGNMIAPADKHYLYINLDMIGRLREKPPLEVTGVGSAGGLEAWLKPYWDHAGFPIVAKRRAPPNSDHASFFNVKVPVIFLFTGLHTEYHRPADTADQINIEGAVKVLDLAGRIALDAITRAEPLVFGAPDPTPPADPATPTEAEKPAPPVAPPAAVPAAGPRVDPAPDPLGDGAQPVRSIGGVRFGVMPGDYADDNPGVLIGQVFENTPASKAGLRAGDRMIKWNGKEIKTVEDWTPLLRAQKAGDVVDVTYVRAGLTLDTKVTLEARRD
ncbi:MAG: M28 family peptidase [Phycisphaeraceae bacterium]|nr:MAG: M28 family peptidase [Phycisphaeraceae bacterium]